MYILDYLNKSKWTMSYAPESAVSSNLDDCYYNALCLSGRLWPFSSNLSAFVLNNTLNAIKTLQLPVIPFALYSTVLSTTLSHKVI